MLYEIEKHWQKLKKISCLSDKQLNEAHIRVLAKINFINEALVPEKVWLYAEKIVSDIYSDDTDFVALTKHLGAHLWTCDKTLYTGLKKKKFKKVLNTQELFLLRDRK